MKAHVWYGSTENKVELVLSATETSEVISTLRYLIDEVVDMGLTDSDIPNVAAAQELIDALEDVQPYLTSK
jgi:hypothetical protein